MKKVASIGTALGLGLTVAGPASAAAGPPHDVLDVALWVFAAYCALVIVPHTLRGLAAVVRVLRRGAADARQEVKDPAE